MLQTYNLCKSFGCALAVDTLDLSVQVGQIRGLLGPNGAGKSTTIRMVCGVLAPTSGSVTIHGADCSTNPTVSKQALGYVPEGAPLPLEFLPIEYLKHTASMYGLIGEERSKAITHWAQRCDIATVLRKPIGSLSRGYRQRVALAAALVHKPQLVVLDEPSTGLDPAQNASFRELLKEVSQSAAILYSSHNLSEVEATCDVVSIINHGKCVFDGDFAALRACEEGYIVEVSPHGVVEQLLGTNVIKIDEDWSRCTVLGSDGQAIANKVADAVGQLRLLHPTSDSIEANYLRIISASEVSA
jgi:ABC-2 type transport system ATP-binding protein